METWTGLGDVRKQTNHRLAEIDDIRKAEDVLVHDLSFQGQLRL